MHLRRCPHFLECGTGDDAEKHARDRGASNRGRQLGRLDRPVVEIEIAQRRVDFRQTLDEFGARTCGLPLVRRRNLFSRGRPSARVHFHHAETGECRAHDVDAAGESVLLADRQEERMTVGGEALADLFDLARNRPPGDPSC